MENKINQADQGQGEITHLHARVAEIRQVMAAHYLRPWRHIVEIGGYRLPVTDFLTHQPRSVTCIDPKTAPLSRDELNGAPCRVRHIAQKFQEVDLDLEPLSYGLVLLGYSLKAFGSRRPDAQRLFDLIDNAGVVVIDYALKLERATSQIPRILERGTLRCRYRIDMVLDDDVIRDSPFAERRFMVLEPVKTGDTDQ